MASTPPKQVPPPPPVPPPAQPSTAATTVTLPSGIIINNQSRPITEALTVGGATYTSSQRGTLTADQKAKGQLNLTSPNLPSLISPRTRVTSFWKKVLVL